MCIIFRCRSAFKLIEINDRTKILRPGQTVIDCGASPGSWTEVAVSETNANGKMKNKPQGFVIGVDLLMIHPIEVKFRIICSNQKPIIKFCFGYRERMY